eukprot:52836-Rhodomonas_salina.2
MGLPGSSVELLQFSTKSAEVGACFATVLAGVWYCRCEVSGTHYQDAVLSTHDQVSGPHDGGTSCLVIPGDKAGGKASCALVLSCVHSGTELCAHGVQLTKNPWDLFAKHWYSLPPYRPTHALCDVRYSPSECYYNIVLCTCCPISGTDRAYWPTNLL